VEQPLKDRSILVVEDDVVLSTDLANFLAAAGCKAVLPTTSVASTLSTIVHYVVDVAILDVNVQNEWVFPVAHALQAARIPFLFLTAYSKDSIPADLRDRPFIQKPHMPQDLIDCVASLLTPAEAGLKLATVDGKPVPDEQQDIRPATG
jgi:DNA-binding response OmpR family regulator